MSTRAHFEKLFGTEVTIRGEKMELEYTCKSRYAGNRRKCRVDQLRKSRSLEGARKRFKRRKMASSHAVAVAEPRWPEKYTSTTQIKTFICHTEGFSGGCILGNCAPKRRHSLYKIQDGTSFITNRTMLSKNLGRLFNVEV